MLSPYNLTEPDDFSYGFVTDNNIHYNVYFLDYNYLFADYPSVASNIFTFNIDVIKGDNNSAIADERIGITIVEVFKKFFKQKKNVAVYVCDSLDERQYARKRKFDYWFWKYNDGTILKEDGVAIIEDVEILNSLLILKSNPHCAEVVFAFKELNERANEK